MTYSPINALCNTLKNLHPGLCLSGLLCLSFLGVYTRIVGKEKVRSKKSTLDSCVGYGLMTLSSLMCPVIGLGNIHYVLPEYIDDYALPAMCMLGVELILLASCMNQHPCSQKIQTVMSNHKFLSISIAISIALFPSTLIAIDKFQNTH